MDGQSGYHNKKSRTRCKNTMDISQVVENLPGNGKKADS